MTEGGAQPQNANASSRERRNRESRSSGSTTLKQTRQGIPPSALPGISPSRGEIASTARSLPAPADLRPPRSNPLQAATTRPSRSPPLRGRCHELTEGGGARPQNANASRRKRSNPGVRVARTRSSSSNRTEQYPPLPCRASPPQGGRSTPRHAPAPSADQRPQQSIPLQPATTRPSRTSRGATTRSTSISILGGQDASIPISPLEGEMSRSDRGGCRAAARPRVKSRAAQRGADRVLTAPRRMKK